LELGDLLQAIEDIYKRRSGDRQVAANPGDERTAVFKRDDFLD
jgi:hypothetical protein